MTRSKAASTVDLGNARRNLGIKLKLARQTKGYTLKELAKRGDCSESLLSKIENGKSMPSLSLVHRLVHALEANISWLFEEQGPQDNVVFRKGDRPFISLEKSNGRTSGVMLERIIPYKEGHLLQCNIHHLEVGGRSGGSITHEGEEVGYVITGKLALDLNDQTYTLEAGDGFCFRSNIPHSYRNIGDEAASILWVCTPPTF
ncbi:MAG: cupin domain-containing protein [Desulfomicrobium sp.]|uniref:cupin domain-containing protein n=1 Tax=Hoeflea sp. TaxID=1940281 RepID=UPI0025B8CA4E|nr:cupin domain-containing protein [Hoeflea sp.]MBU4529259.1 cupin domain-containing protein [Alphaproteobacteria bacterium]MBV1714147.1 cupin domain-containing protein [Desulfomicrobium sp.]MBU4542316.1 cupin domain-containing protein [Alphaproteobacteria bacterium]MBU4551380.1 cupin domain-containing protein [Alphaproteobacteria bacterium]MBV1784196.1 cupin domain-containing protein [Hoeflea sp.]